jgi:hypothetical protein
MSVFRGLSNVARRIGIPRRFSSLPQNQAFLEPLANCPGITCLSLNRPQSKNAISLVLLEVTYSFAITCRLLRFTLPTFSNSGKAWRAFILTRGISLVCCYWLMLDMALSTVSVCLFSVRQQSAHSVLALTLWRGVLCHKLRLLSSLSISGTP